VADREPIGGTDRPNGDMTDPRPAQGAAHASHDPFVLAAAADRDADTMTRLAAEHQVRACEECASLFADLQALSAGLSGLPRELPAPRDFRLTPERAASLRRPGWRAALDGLFRNPSLRPFGTALATLGFAGLFLTVAMPAVIGGLGSAGSAPAALSTQGSPGSAPEAVPAASAAAAPGVGAGGAAGGGKVVATPPADTSTGGSLGAAASGQPTVGRYGYGGQTPLPTGDRFAANGQRDAHGPGPAPATPAIDPLAFIPWLSLGAFVVGLGLLLAARLGGRARVG